MANDLVKLPQLSTHAETKGKILSFHAGQTATVKMEQGLHYILRRAPKGDATTPLEVPDNVIASRQGDALHLRYSDSSTITFENFYSVCTTDSACSVNLVGDTENGITLSASNAAGGSVSGDTGTLVYAHGNHDVLMSMAQGQSNMAGAFTALGESPVVTYFPQTLAMEAAGLAPASAGFAAVPALIGGSILMGTGSAGTGSAGNGVAAPSIVNGSIQAGPVISGNDLLVNIYAGDKTTLLKANVLVDASGHFTTNVGSYVGVVFAQLVVTGTALDYMDEATGVGKNLSSALTAMGVVTGPGSTLSLNLNVLTTIAANKIDPNASVATVNGVNKAVATTFGLTDLQGPVVTTVLSTYNAADGLSAAENYGAVLAALSGMDKLNGGDVAATINQLTGSIALSGSGSSSATTMSDAGKYNIAAGAKVVILAGSGTVTNQFGSAVATLINYAANPTTGTLGLTAIGNATDSAVGTVPTQFDYANANVTGIDSSAKLQLINDVVKSLVLANVDTVGEVQSLSDAVTAVINSPAGGTPPTWVQLNALGILGVTSGNLSAVLAAIANTSPDGSAVDTQAELQALVNTINTAVGVLSSYAQANTASAPATPTGTAPLLGNYSAAGITGVDSSNLHAINDALATAAITGTQADTPAKIQTIVNAYNAILASADGNAATAATALTAAQFAAIGADIGLAVSSPQILSLLDDSIGSKTAAAVDSVAEVNQLAAAANAVANQAAGISGLTMADLAALGITGITDALGATGSVTALSAANIQSILSAISATPDTGTGVDTLAKIQALVNAAVDLTPPMAPVITAIAGDNTINAAEQGAAVSGTAEAHSVITITLGGTSHSVTTDASGNWSYALQPADISAMGQGTEVISVTATDAAGNISPAGTRTIRVDTLAPTLAMGVIAGDAILNKTEHDALSSTTHLQISGSTTGVEDGQVVAITLNYLQYSATVTGNAWTLNLPNADALALNHGNSYSAIASVSDAAGNVSNVVSSAVLIDIAAPDIPTVHQKVTNNTRPTLSGHAEKTLDAGLSFLKLEVATSDVISVLVNGITYTLTLGGTSSPAGLTYNTGTGDWALDLSGAANPMTNGNYEVAVSVTAAGLSKGDISSNELKINTTGVVVAMAGITSDDAVNAAEKGGTVLLHGTSSNLEAGQTVDLTLVDGSIVHATVQADGSWSTLVAGSSFNAEGAQSVTANATNAAGTSATPLVHNLLVDSVAPTATVVLANSALLAGQTSTVTITFSEAVSGFDNNDLNVGNGTLSAVSSVDGGITWTATFTPSGNVVSATNAITLNKTGVSDAAGNAGVGSSSSANYAIDTHRPTAAITLSDTALKAGETATATITFSEAVTGFDNGDLSISNGVLSAVSSGDGGITWTATFTPTTDFTAASNFITLSNSGVSNTAGNAGAGQTSSASYAVDTHTPVVTAVTDSATAAITRGTISFTVAFDETLAGAVGNGNFSATNGVITSVTPVDGSHYTVVVTPNANVASGNVALSLVAAGLTDAAGNALANADLSGLDSQGVDTRAPSISSVADNTVATITNSAITYTVTFDEAVVGTIDRSSFGATSGSITSVNTVDNIHYTVVVTPTPGIASGNVALSFIANGQTDATGNPLANADLSGQNSQGIDTLAPSTPATAPASYADNAGSVVSAASGAAFTDDSTPGLVIGSLPVDASDAFLYVDGVKVAASYDAATGTLTPTTPLTEGPHSLSYSLTDLTGNESGRSAALTVTVDTTPPTAPAGAPGSFVDNSGTVQSASSAAATTDDTTPGIHIGTLPSGVTGAVLYVDGVPVAATYDAVTGALTPTVPLTEGAHTLGYGYIDASGNASASGPALGITVDLTAPTAPVSAPGTYIDNTGTLQSNTGTAATTDDTQPGIAIGSLPAGVTDAVLYVDGVLVAATYDAATGALTPTVPLSEGVHTFGYGYVDAAGNASASGPTLSITVDVTPPTAPASAPVGYIDNTGTVQSATSTAATTDDTTPAINIGALPSGVTDAVLYVDGILVPATYDAATGALTPTAPLTEGAHTFGYGYVDVAGNASVSSPTLSITVDLTAPTAPATAPASYIDSTGTLPGNTSTAATADDTTPGIHIGSLPAGVTDAVLYVDGVQVAATYDAATGALTPTVPLTEGVHTFGYGYVDAAGNTSASGPTLSITIDLTAPTAPASAPANYIDNTGTVHGATSTAATTDDTTPGIAIGALPVGVTDAVLYVDGTLVAATYDAATGALTPTVPLTEGVHTFGFGYVDAAGNASASGPTLSITVDLTAPTAPAIAPASFIDNTGTVQSTTSTATTTDDATPGINIGSLPSGVTDAMLYVDGVLVAATYDAATGALTPTVPLTEGAHTFGYGYVDAAGNASASGPTLSITIDLTAPTAPTINAVATDNFINANEQGSAIGGSAEPFSTITLTLANGDVHIVSTDASGNWSYTLQPADITAMGQGQSQISATATDVAGNVSSAGNHNVTLDTIAPTIAIGTIAGNGTLDKTEYDVLAATPLAISGSTSGAENGQHVTVTLNGKSYDTTVTNDAWSVDLPLLDAQALNHGSTYTATASVADAAGNVSNVASANVVINIAFPDTPTVHQLITNSATPTISGHAEKIDGGNFIALASGDQLAVSVNGTPYILTVGGNSNPAGLSYNGTTRDWTLDLTGMTAMADGTYDVSVSVTAGSATQPDISLNEVTINTAPVTVAIATITGEDLVSAAEKSGNVIVHGSSTNLEAGALVHLTLVNGTTVDATVAGDGSWSTSVAGSTFSIEGAQHVIANATNAAGTSVNHTTNLTADHLVTVDTVAPVVTTITDSTSAALTNATISFAVTFDEAIFGTVDISSFSATHGSVTSVVSTDNIHYTVVVMPTAGIATDNVTLSLIANGQTDAAGNTMVSADLSAKDSQGIDTLAPSSPTLALHGDSGTSSSDGITNDNVVNVSGLESGATWQYQMDGGSWVTGSGTTFNLSSSAHAYAVRQTDAAGNTGAASGNYSYTLDTTAAIVNSLAITSATGAQNNYLNVGDVVTVTVHMSKTVTVTGTPRLGLTIGASIAQASYVSGSGSADLVFSYTIQTLQFDANGISIAANSLVAGTGTITDIAGNTAVLGHALVTDNASYRVDTVVTNPSFGLATDSGSSSTDKITNVATIDVTGLEAGATWQYSTDTGNSWTTGSGSTFALSTEQTYAVGTIQVKQTDLAGNTSTASSNNSGAWTYDHTAAAAPSLALHGDSGTSLTDGITNDAVISVGGLESGGTWQYSTDNGTSWSSAQSSSTTSFSLSTEQSYAIGSVQVRQTDVAGNVSNVASNVAAWTYDHTPPSDTLTTATLPVTSNAIAQSSEAGIAYLVATSVTVSTLADITGAADALWNQTTISAANSNTNMPLTGLNAGTYKLYSQDAAGNLSAASANTVTVHDAPVFSSTTIANNAALYTQSNVTLTPTYSNQTLTAGNLVTASGSTGVVTVVLNGVTYFRLGDLNATESVNLSFSSPVNTVVITWYLQTGNSDTNRFEDLSMSANGSPITFLAANLVAQTGMSISSTDPTKIVCVGQGGDSVTPAVYTYTGTGITSFSVTDNFRSGNPNGLDVKVAVSTPGFGTAVSNLAPAITADPGGTSIRGYAITAAAASSNDKWQYSTNGGTVWSDLTAASLSNAFYLAPTDTVRWTGKIDTESALSMVAVDNSGAALHAANAVAGTLDVTTRGGSTAYSANIATLAANATPLILDLNGDGVQTTTVDHGVLFDIANTGALNQTAWANANDGLLVRDINHDGVINNGAELFGNGTLLADGSHAANGFGALAQFDSNHDGKIDAQDAVFQELKVWRDTNGDGVSQANELLSMQELGIVSFNLSATQGSVMENGNTLGLVSSYTTADGAVHDLADVWFQQGAQFTLDTDAAGIHYLHLGTSGQPLDLTSVDTNRLHGVNVIDMLSNSTADSLTIALQQVLEMGSVNVVNHSTAGLSGGSYQFGATESRHQLMVSGDASDSIIVSGGFVDSGLSAVISGHIYEVYNHGSDAQLMVEQAMNRTLMG